MRNIIILSPEDLQTLEQGEVISCDNDGTVIVCAFSVEDAMRILQNAEEGVSE